MPNLDFIGPAPFGTPSDSSRSSRTVRALPSDLLQEAARRLATLSLLAAVLWVLATVLYQLAIRAATEGDPRSMQPALTNVIAGISAVLSLALYFYARRHNRDPRFILNLGLIYMVFIAAAIGPIYHIDPVLAARPVMPMITWIGPVLLMFAAIVPNRPGRMLVAGLLAASMNPLGMLFATAHGTWHLGAPSDVVLMHYPDYLLVGVAVVISHVVTRLGQQVTKAREMGSYRLVTMLGQGGMGEVWRASHRMLARDAAIKLIQPDILIRDRKNAELMRRRFEQEAKTTASLRSPHTVQLYDFGITEDGTFYYVMELLDGIDLETLVKKYGPQPAARVAHILRQVCGSLAEANHRGMIHRDIKPTNIFLCRMGNEYDFAKVLDFGLVKVLSDPDEPHVTLPGATTGTPAYMAPELALGQAHIDGRTDLYGLGCVAYWLITGRLVFDEKNGTAMMLAHLNNAPVPPSKRSELEVPSSLERAIMMCLAKEPVQRPTSPEKLARMLESNDIGSWTPEDAQRWWYSHLPGNTQVPAGSKPQPDESSGYVTL